MKVMSDTNIFLRLNNEESPENEICVQSVQDLEDAEQELCFCGQVMIEYWSTATRPQNVNGFGKTPEDVLADIEELMASFTLLPEPPDIAQIWLNIVKQYRGRGKQVHDARLAALMSAHNITHLLTLNGADFARFETIVCIHPADVKDLVKNG